MITSVVERSSPNSCAVSMNSIAVPFLRYSREHLLEEHRKSRQVVALNPVISVNEASFIKSPKEIDMTAATNAQENTPTQQNNIPRLLSVEDIAKRKGISHSYVYALLKKLEPEVAARDGKTNYYNPSVLEKFPERQRARSRKTRRISANQPAPQGQQESNVQQQPTQQTLPLMQRVEQLETALASLAKMNEAIVESNKALLEQMEALRKSLGV